MRRMIPVPELPPAENDGPVVAAPDGWAELRHCPGGPNDDWMWVEGFPNEAFEAAGVEPVCGDSWVEPDGDHFLNVTHPSVTEADLDALGAGLGDLGYVALFDDFTPVSEGAMPICHP